MSGKKEDGGWESLKFKGRGLAPADMPWSLLYSQSLPWPPGAV